MKKGRKTNNYKRIHKLLHSNVEDRLIGIELLLVNLEKMHPDEWRKLNDIHSWSKMRHVSAEEIQEYLYDKRKEERGAFRQNKETPNK